ncbi:hypothetical protein ACS0TY_033999 [Phlomoides rotata]
MLSSVQASTKGGLTTHPCSVFNNLITSPPLQTISFSPNPTISLSNFGLKITRIQRLPPPAVAATEHETLTHEFSPQPQEKGVEVIAKTRLVLKFIWMEKNIGVGLDQQIPGHGSVPLSPYFFWPRKDAWEELKATLETKPWISQKKMIILLNQATDIINLWQQSGGNFS